MRGRPRSEKTKEAILKASYELLLEEGFKATTVDKIADRAGVSKTTIYKWWNNKAAVMIDGFFEVSELKVPMPDTGSAKKDIIKMSLDLHHFLNTSQGRAIREFVGEGQMDENIAKEYQEKYFSRRREYSKEILKRGIHRGEIKKDLDTGKMTDLLFGPFFYRFLLTGEKMSDLDIYELIDYVFEGIENKLEN